MPPDFTVRRDTADYRCESHDSRLGDHEVRIRALERFQVKTAAIVGMLAFAGSILGPVVIKAFTP